MYLKIVTESNERGCHAHCMYVLKMSDLLELYINSFLGDFASSKFFFKNSNVLDETRY